MTASKRTSKSRKRSSQVLAFDVYGTLIDPFHMEEHLRDAFGENAKRASEMWRSKQVEYSFRRALMKKYRDFNVCTAQALRFVCEHFGVALPAKAQQALLEQYLRLPAFPDVPEALRIFEESRFTLAACSNGTEKAVRELLRHAGVVQRFTKIVSVDKIRTFKPDPAVYKYLTAQMRTTEKMIWLISSNPFDVIGAKACGLRTVWLQRDPKMTFDPWEFEPDLVVHSLAELPGKLFPT